MSSSSGALFLALLCTGSLREGQFGPGSLLSKAVFNNHSNVQIVWGTTVWCHRPCLCWKTLTNQPEDKKNRMWTLLWKYKYDMLSRRHYIFNCLLTFDAYEIHHRITKYTHMILLIPIEAHTIYYMYRNGSDQLYLFQKTLYL